MCVYVEPERTSVDTARRWGVMYHMAHSAAAAISCKNKGVFMSSLTDSVFINVLPRALPRSDAPSPALE